MGTDYSIWPKEVVHNPIDLPRDNGTQLICFLMSPFEPKDVFDQVHEAVRAACSACTSSTGAEIVCKRADTLVDAKPIHDDIWRHIAAADFLVLDVTDLNPNVMIELGVAAAIRDAGHVILIRDATDSSRPPFNTAPQRFLSYSRSTSIVGDARFIHNLACAMVQAITPAPYHHVPLGPPSPDDFALTFSQGDSPNILLSPPIAHRRICDGQLEFGSFYVFRNSWLLLTNENHRNAKVRVKFKFGETVDNTRAFFGIALRSQHFFANYQHMVLLHIDGRIKVTQPEDDKGGYHDIESLGRLASFDATNPVDMTVEFTEDALHFSINGTEHRVPETEMPHVFTAGKTRLVTSFCRVLLTELHFTSSP